MRFNRDMRLALLALVLGRAAMLALWFSMPVKPHLGLLVLLLLLDLAVLSGQLWLIHRARRLSGTGFASFLMALIAIIAIAYTLSTDVNRTATALLRPPPAPAAQALLETDGTRAMLKGDIGFDSYNATLATLSAMSGLETLDLDSSGGRIAAARGIARLVRENGLSTHVSGTCASACTIIFAAGTSRSMADNARIGFHGYRLVSNVTTLSTTDEQDRDKAEFKAQGISTAFIDRALAVPHDEMWFPTRAELLGAGVLTD